MLNGAWRPYSIYYTIRCILSRIVDTLFEVSAKKHPFTPNTHRGMVNATFCCICSKAPETKPEKKEQPSSPVPTKPKATIESGAHISPEAPLAWRIAKPE